MLPRFLSLCPLVLLASCADKKESESAYPVAASWQTSETGRPAALGPARPGSVAPGADPHAGLGIDVGGADPHAGVGIDVEGADPHAGLLTGDAEGFSPPDPNRPIDPGKVLSGTVQLAEGLRSKLGASPILFLSVRPIDPTTGDSLGAPLAVDILRPKRFPLDFRLGEAQMMVDGTVFDGAVSVYARIDGDGEATTREAGDLEGSVLAEIPQEKLRIVIDTVVSAP